MGLDLAPYHTHCFQIPDIPGVRIMANLRNAIYHDCLRHVFASIKRSSQVYDTFTLGQRGQFSFTTVVGVNPADYIEMYVTTATV